MQQKTRHNFGKNEQLFIFVHSNILNFCIKNAIFLLVLDEKSGISQMCWKISKFAENAEKNAKFCEISVQNPELLQLFIPAEWIIQSTP